MAHFAKIDNSNIVEQVVVLDNSLESIGSEYLSEHYGGTWIQTSYNANFGSKYAGIGDIWDGTNFTTPVIEVPEEVPKVETSEESPA